MAMNFPDSPTTGQTFSVSGGPTYSYDGAKWRVLTPGNSFVRTTFTATASQTVFTVSYTVGAVDVFKNGLKLVSGVSFTATNGTSITLSSGATAGDVIEVVSYSQITYTAVSLTSNVTGTLPVANGGTNASSAGITAFNNITGYTASGATGTTSTNLVFSTSPSITTPTIVTSATGPLFIGGTTASSSLTLQSTSGVGTSDSILFKVGNNGGTTAATIDTAGNLGLGVTPSAWYSNRKVLAIGTGASGVATVNYVNAVGENAYNMYYTSGGVATYQLTGPAAIYDFNNATSGGFAWRIAGSGSAGGTISFTQVMTLDASGVLSITKATGTSQLQVGASSNYYWDISRDNDTTGALMFRYKNGGSVNEAARIDSSGNLLVGTTSAGTSGNGFKVQPAGNGSGIPITFLAGNSTNDAHGSYHVYSTADSSYKFYATYAGKIYAITTAVQAITSDINLKTDIQDYEYGLAEVCAMKPRYFKYKTDLNTRHAGFIAQEMEEAIPGSMVDAIDGKNKTYSADWYPILVKAIQELAAKVSALEAKI